MSAHDDDRVRESVTEILRGIADDRLPASDGLDRLYPVVYDELRQRARILMRGQKADHTLAPTALVHEAYLKLVDQSRVRAQSRGQFFCLAAKAMRSVLVDHARRKNAEKRGGDRQRVTLHTQIGTAARELEVLSLNDAMDKLAAEDERMAQVVELRVFAGLTAQEAADALGVSRRTADRDWKVARLWLSDRMGDVA